MSEAIAAVDNTVQNGLSAGSRQKAVLLSAPACLDTSAVRKALASQGVSSFTADQLDLPGQNLAQILREGMQRADLVVGVVDATPASSSVFYELGFARALNKSTLVFVIGDVPLSPWLSSGVPYFRFDPEKPVGLEFGIAQVLKAPHHGTKGPTIPAKRTRPLGPRADELLAELRAAGAQLREEDLDRIIERAIRDSGVTTFSSGGGNGQAVDFAVWSDDWRPWVGNPLAIEVRTNVSAIEDLHSAVGRLAQALAGVSMPWGLLIYVYSKVDVEKELKAPFVLTLPAEQFLTSLRETSFGDLIRRLRHERAHRSSGYTRSMRLSPRFLPSPCTRGEGLGVRGRLSHRLGRPKNGWHCAPTHTQRIPPRTRVPGAQACYSHNLLSPGKGRGAGLRPASFSLAGRRPAPPLFANGKSW